MSGHVVRDPGIKKHDGKQRTADSCLESRDLRTAVKLSRENLAWSENVLGPTDLVTLADRDSLAFALHESGKYFEAVDLDEGTLRIRKQKQGHEDPETLETQHNLALNFYKVGRYQEAANLDRKTLKARETNKGRRDEDTLSSRHNLAASLQELRIYDEAEILNREVLRTRERRCQQDDPDLVSSRHNLAINLYWLRRYDEAAAFLRENLDVLRKARDKDDTQLATCEKLLEMNDKELAQRMAMEEKKREERKMEEKKREEEKMEAKREEERKAEEKSKEEKRKEKRQEERKMEEKRKEEKRMEERKIEEKVGRVIVKAAKAKAEDPTSKGEKDTKIGVRNPEHGKRERDGTDEGPTMPQRGRAENDKKGDTKKSSPSMRVERPEQAGTISKTPLEFRHVRPQEVLFDKKANDQERDSSAKEQTLSPSNEKKIQRRRAKSDQDIAKSSSSGETLATPSKKPERPKSAGPTPDETVHRVTDPPRRKSLDVPSRPDTTEVLSKFYDAHVGDSNSYISDAADQWFKDLESDTQALLEPCRKDRMKRVKIAILDTGIDRTHARIEAQWSKRVKGVKSWVKGEDGDIDHCGHGTHAAALLMKVAPEAHIYVARIAKDHGSSIDQDSVAQAIMHAADEWNVNIITMSFGFAQRYLRIVSAVKHAWVKGIIIFAAASNDGARRQIAFPANLSSIVISINSADGGGARSRYNPPAQDTGDNFSVLGEAVPSAWPTKPGKAAERRQWGTSTSTPIAAAIAALVLELVLELDKQPKGSRVKISHRTTLQNDEGMREIFRRMSEAKDGYNFVVPWKLLSKRFTREGVAQRLSNIMDDKFGAETRYS